VLFNSHVFIFCFLPLVLLGWWGLRRPTLRLVDLEDVSRYCCIVAGLVGEMLTQLWGLDRETPPRMIHRVPTVSPNVTDRMLTLLLPSTTAS